MTSAPASIAVTGLKSFVGSRLLARLLERTPTIRVVGIDVRRPFRLDERVRFHNVDLSEPDAGAKLADVLRQERVEALVHCAFRREPTPDLEMDHEVETIGSLHVLNACAAAKLHRLVVASSTMLYGPRADNPNFLTEAHPLRGHPQAHCVSNRVEVEELVGDWSTRHPDTEVSVLRSCWTLGTSARDPVEGYFSLPIVPTLLGYDPLLQFVHEDDLLDAYEHATLASFPGVTNVVGRGVLPLSTLLRLGGRRNLPLPARLLYRMASAPSQAQSGDPPGGFYDYLRYLWVADGRRGWDRFGEPEYTTQEAWISFISSRRMRRYR